MERTAEQTARAEGRIARSLLSLLAYISMYVIPDNVADLMVERGPTNLTVWADHQKMLEPLVDLQRIYGAYIATGEDPTPKLQALLATTTDKDTVLHMAEALRKVTYFWSRS